MEEIIKKKTDQNRHVCRVKLVVNTFATHAQSLSVEIETAAFLYFPSAALNGFTSFNLPLSFFSFSLSFVAVNSPKEDK